jgi:hypothetical protein
MKNYDKFEFENGNKYLHCIWFKVQPHMVSKKDGLIAKFGFLFPKEL